MDVQTIRRVLADFIKFDPADFFVKASATSFLVRNANRNRDQTFCDFKLSKIVDAEGTKFVGVGWGRVNNGQPSQFNGVVIVTEEVSDPVYIFVYADYEMITAQWTNRNLLFSDTADIPNTATRAYVQIGMAALDINGRLVTSDTCGPVTLDPCALEIE